MGELERKLAKLEREVLGPERYSHGFGKSAEEIMEEHKNLPYWVAQRAHEYAAMRERGETTLDDEIEVLAEGSGTDRMAVIISYGPRENIPEEISKAADEISRVARAEPGGLPPEMSKKLTQFVIDTDARAREIFLSGE